MHCSTIFSPARLPPWITCLGAAFLFPPAAVLSPSQGVRCCLQKSFSFFCDCEMMLLDNALTNVEKNRVGWGNHQGREGNRSRVTLQLSISFLSLLSLSLRLARRHTQPRCYIPKTLKLCFASTPNFIRCRLLTSCSGWRLSFTSTLPGAPASFLLGQTGFLKRGLKLLDWSSEV